MSQPSQFTSCDACIAQQGLYWCNSAPKGQKCRNLPEKGEIPGPEDKDGCRPDSTTCQAEDSTGGPLCKCQHCYLENSLQKNSPFFNCGPYPPFPSIPDRGGYPVSPPYSPSGNTNSPPSSNKKSRTRTISITDWIIISVLAIIIIILAYLYISFRWFK